MKISAKDGKVFNQVMTKKSLERFGEAEIFDETNGLRLDFIERTEWI